MKLTRLILSARSNLLVGPGTMRDGSFQQRAILKFITENAFQEVEIRNFDSLFLQGRFLSK